MNQYTHFSRSHFASARAYLCCARQSALDPERALKYLHLATHYRRLAKEYRQMGRLEEGKGQR